MLGLEEAGKGQPVHIVDVDAQLVHEPCHRFGDDLGIALVAGPAFFPHVVVVFAGSPVVVDEIIGHRMAADKLGDDVFSTHANRCSAVAEPHFIEIGRFGQTFVGGGHQHLAFVAAFDRGQGFDQGGGSRPER